MTLPSLPQVGTAVRAPKTAELIASHLRHQIVRKELRPGDTLPPEIELMEQFGVSRPTLREAFRILETETLISVRRGSRGGAQVMSPDTSVAARYVGLLLQLQGTTINDLYRARTVVEPACARLLATRRTEQDLADLRAAVAEIESEIDASSTFHPVPTVWAELTYRFHELVLERSGSKTLAVQAAVLHDIVTLHLHATIARTAPGTDSRDRYLLALRSYRRLIELVEARDADGAERLWRKHMAAAATFLVDDEQGQDRSVVDLFE